jgi:ectoine hydroxylase-related dioxygenase (phytanoyl-CoA dioxygenase family)
MIAGLESSLRNTITAGDGTVYAARNVLDAWPPAVSIWRRPVLLGPLTDLLGPGFGLVRGLHFDKPPGNSWSLPWHKDLTVAVRDNRLPSVRFRRPTAKAGVPHVEAPVDVLERMLTLRIHLDAADEDNGALKVIPGSHLLGKTLQDGPVVTVRAAAGDVLLMRPLLAHCSGRSREGSPRHRRVLHLEFAADGDLGDGYEWHSFVPG